MDELVAARVELCEAEKRGQRRPLRVVFGGRFAPLTQESLRRFETMSSEELDRLAESIVSAESLKELGLED